MRRFLIDTDTASDDAIALLLAFAAPDVRIEAITMVAGNCRLDQAAQNALYVRELVGAEAPVHLGRDAPLLRPLVMAADVHGHDGLGDIGLPLHGRTADPGHAADVIRTVIRRHPGEVTLVTLGPLTNVALALLRDPELAGLVRECVVMGGVSDGFGNITPAAEFNIYVDPEAAKIVFGSGLKITMVGWDISRKYALLSGAELDALKAIGTKRARFAVDILAAVRRYVSERTGEDCADLPDPIAMAIALDPTIATKVVRRAVIVDTSDGPSMGATLVDHHAVTGRTANADVVVEASREKFIARLRQALAVA
ncbi:nucleoside hydrolase [Segnochrobactrum spirostomi]|uniref:Nucleoside hydrolase n=1 Tax=Segnochrobactrum spirostomi TaxID=2608987 RepID=A0A6A7Y0U1_9HYPH|nr:nucleoside hydrolase [Segnochrobactrum spirostomi]MQT12236.1 nucleoside hydrolase [Segnochrobactrum spirostomi]